MRKLTHAFKGPRGRRLASLLSAAILLTAGAGTAVFSAAGPADAAACGTAVPAGTSCTVTGSLTLSGGTLTLTSPTALGWTGTLNGTDLNLVDPTTADQSYLVNDATGSGLGWHVTTSATQFTTSGAVTLGNTGTFSTNGSTTSMTGTAAPAPVCSTGSTCTLPTNTTTYPVAITTAATSPTPVTIYDTSATTGLGSIVIGSGANPVGWWLNVPANTKPGTYTSTVTMEVISAP